MSLGVCQIVTSILPAADCAMHVWHPKPMRRRQPSAVERWAALEAKSETMRDDLIQRYEAPRFNQPRRTLLLALLSELITAAIAALLHARNR
jgi:hypothetical protein